MRWFALPKTPSMGDGISFLCLPRPAIYPSRMFVPAFTALKKMLHDLNKNSSARHKCVLLEEWCWQDGQPMPPREGD